MKKLLLLLSVLITAQLALAQAQFSCGSDDAHQRMLLADSNYAKAIQASNTRYAQMMQSSSNGLLATVNGGTKYQIPLVVHVVHTGGAVGSIYNPTDSAIISMINYLNQTYAATYASYPDSSSGGTYFPVEFVLAKRNTGCGYSNGINRVNGNGLANYTLRGVNSNNTTGAAEADVKALSRWNNHDYYNIWIVNKIDSNDGTFGTYTAGYAYYPGASPTVDGTIMLATTVYAGNITLPHEIGHAFNLRHTFEGDGTGSTCPPTTNCTTTGDLVCDTEPHKRSVFNCPTDPNPCTGNSYANVQKNIMDYSNCQDRFTPGQKVRWLDALLNERAGLVSSIGSVDTGTNVASNSCSFTTANVNNGYNLGPALVNLNDLSASSNGGYSQDNFAVYLDRSCQQRANIIQGQSYTLSVKTEGPNAQKVAVYIDYDNNGSFSAGELVYSHTGNVAGDETHTTTYSVPTSGITTCTPLRMRVLATHISGSIPTNGCGNFSPGGQAEDYSVLVKPSSANITATVSGTNPSCNGSSVTFTVTPSTTLTSPSYQWYLNNAAVGTNSASYTAPTTLANGSTLFCKINYTGSCGSDSVQSNTLNIVRNSSTVTPSVAIGANPGNTICNGTSVTFTATPTNGGTSPTYQWKLNGGNVGAGGVTYTNASLANNDKVTCVMTSNATCASPTTATSNEITMVVTGTVTPSVSIAANPGTTICSGTSVTFTATPTNGGTSPTYQWKLNGGNVGTGGTTYTNASLSNNDVVTCVMTSNASCASTPTATSNGLTMTVTSTVTPSVSIAANPGNSICTGTSVTFTATPTNGGTSPMYQWKLNGGNVGTGGTTYTNASLSNNDVVSCVMTSNAACATPSTATSNSITMSVGNALVPSVSIASNAGTTICSGASVTFTATPTNGGTNPTYQWKLNGTNVGTNNPQFNITSLANNDVVTCVMTSNATCATPTTATSNSITMSVTTSLTPIVTISANPGNVVCTGTSITFTATPTGGGTSPTYQWKLNGANVGMGGTTYTNASLSNNDVVSCNMTSNATCATPATVASNNMLITISPQITPSVSIAANPGTTVCAGATTATFTATPTGGGTSPTYQWKLNGANVGTGGATYTNTTISNNDVISCVMTSNLGCVTTPTATSNSLTMSVVTPVTPSVSIAANPGNTICTGASVTFTATPTNGGTSPTYQWKVNGTNVGTGGTTYTSTTLSNSDVVTCVLTSSEPCVTSATATSNSITMTVNAIVTPSITITPNPNDTVCAGTVVGFFSNPVNGGVPFYQWQVNGVDVTGETNSTFNTSTLVTGDVVTVVLTSNLACLTTTTATSPGVTMTVNTPVTPSVSIAVAPSNTICSGTSVTFTATPTNGGTSPTYQWKVNGVNVTGSGATYTSSTLSNSDAVSCVMTTSLSCVTSTTATSNTINMAVTPSVTPAVVIAPAPNDTICAGTSVTFTATPTNGGTSPTYQWKVNGINVGTGGTTYTTTALANGDVVSCVMTSNAACATSATATSNSITMTVNPNLIPLVTTSVSPNDTICVGTSVTFSSSVINGGATPSYQWKKNGTDISGATSATYTSSTLVNNDVITVVMTSSETCLLTATATSTGITMTVNQNLTPDVSISVSPNDTICAGTQANFMATPVNGGTMPTYQWTLNGANVGTSSLFYASSTLTSGDVIRCILTSSETCVTKTTDTSNLISMHVNPLTIPTVSISSNIGTTTCEGGTVVFSSSYTNGGTSRTYQWKRNGTAISGATSSTYTTNTLSNSDVITCDMTISAVCPAPATVTSNALTMTVLVPSLSIQVSPTDTICAGTAVMFSLNKNNVGPNPQYQWYLNNVTMIGVTADVFTLPLPADGDEITTIFTGSDICVNAPRNADTVKLSVTSITTPVATIYVTPDSNVTPGQYVIFNAVTNAKNPSFQWRKNGIDITGETNSTFVTGSFVDQDTISCLVTTPDSCATASSVLSNKIKMSVAPVSVKQIAAKQLFDDITLSPNPNGGAFYITGKLSSSSHDEDIKVEVINTLGAVVYRGTISVDRGEFKHYIDLGDIADGGLHMARLHLNGSVHYIKFVTAR
ncbi:MAG: M43 family zinc metalloprotease [Flavipsychrobacter sp.]